MEENGRIVRQYQQELFEKARERNTIVCLPTGSGKTYISTLLIRNFKEEIIGDYNENAKRTFFLVPTKPLVKQQAAELRSHLIENVMELTGESYDENGHHIDKWDINIWNKYLCENEIFVMTYQILLNALNHAFIPLNKINLLIFDEAHHAGEKKKNKKSSHPAGMIMEYIKDSKSIEEPRILGLTASIVKARVEVYELPRFVAALEEIYGAKCETVPKACVISTNPCEELWFFQRTENRWPIITDKLVAMGKYFSDVHRLNRAKCQEMSEEQESECENLSYEDLLLRATLPIGFVKLSACFRNLASTLIEMGPNSFLISVDGYLNYLKRYSKFYEHVYKIYSDFLKNLIDYLTNIRDWIHEIVIEKRNALDQLLYFATPKMIILLNLLLNYNPKINDQVELSAIIFIERIVDAVTLSNFLQKLAKFDKERFGFIKADYVVGTSSMPGFSHNLIKQQDSKRQNTILQDFRDKNLNVIVATSVLEEGLDVSSCNLICRYDFPANYRSWVQSKGRARSKQQPYFIVLAPGSSCDQPAINFYCKELTKYREIEERLDQIAIDNQRDEVDDRYENNDSDVDSDILYNPETNAKITRKGAEGIVKMYCHRLPNDAFTVLTPYLILHKNTSTNNCRVEVKMPVNSCLTESVFGDENKSTKRAKESAFLNVCKELYKRNKLDEHLVPMKQSKAIEIYYKELDLDFKPMDDLTLDEIELRNQALLKRKIDNKKTKLPGTPGSRGRKQTYNLALSELLTITTDETFSLYLIYFKPQYGHTFYSDESSIGLLINQQLPFHDPIKFFVFNRFGQMNIELPLNKKITLTASQKCLLEKFRLFVQKFIIKMKTDETQFNACFFTVLDEKLNINWKLIENFINECKYNEELSQLELFHTDENDIRYRRNFEYNKNDYCNCVLATTYHGDKGTSYYGTFNYSFEKKPNSRYDESVNEKYSTYNEYYEKKYLLKILNQEQHLVDVFNLNFSYTSPTKILLHQKLMKSLNRKRSLVPELTLRFSVLPSLWEKLMALPSIVFCLNRKLIVKELKNKIDLTVFNVESTIETFDDKYPKKCFDDENYNSSVEKTDINEQKIEQQKDMNINDNTLIYEYQSVLKDLAQKRFIDDDNSCDDFSDDDDYFDNEMINSDIEDNSGYNDNLEDEEENDNVDEKVNFGNVNIDNISLFSQESNKGYVRRINESTNIFGIDEYDKLKLPTMLAQIIDDFDCDKCDYYENKIKESVSELLNEKKDSNNLTELNSYVETVESISSRVAVDEIRMLRCMEKKPGLPEINELIEALTAKRFDELENYERLETIGDSFLKFATSLYFFSTYSELNVGCLVLLKDKQVSNYNLYRLAKQTKIPELIFNHKFNAKEYLMFKQQIIDDKCIADCIEALIGAYLLKSPMKAIKFMNYIGLNVCRENNSLESEEWLDEPKLPEICYTQEGGGLIDLFYRRQNLILLEKKLNYTFKNKGFLVQALTHPSFYDNHITGSYQRLEFLGDAVLDFLITDYMYGLETKLKPGEMTHLRQSLVNNSFFGALTVKHNFDKFLMHFSSDLFSSVTNFKKTFENICGGKLVLGAFVLVNEYDTLEIEDIDIPKALGDIFESIAAAIYLDSGRSLKEVWKVYYPLMMNELEYFRINIPVSPIRVLHYCCEEVKFSNCEVLGKNKHKITLTIKNIRSKRCMDGEDHEDEEISFDALGRTKKSAKITAAKKAIRTLKLSECN